MLLKLAVVAGVAGGQWPIELAPSVQTQFGSRDNQTKTALLCLVP